MRTSLPHIVISRQSLSMRMDWVGVLLVVAIFARAGNGFAQQQDEPSFNSFQRAPLPTVAFSEPLPWERLVELGPDFIFVSRIASHNAEGDDTRIRLSPSLGFGVHAQIPLFRYLRFSTYFLDTSHSIVAPKGSLGEGATIETESVHTFAFGARICPTFPVNDRFRAWVSMGIGWGRLEYSEMQFVDEENLTMKTRERADSFAQLPIGVGFSIDIVPRWLSVEYQTSSAYYWGQEGEASQNAQVIDSSGNIRHLSGLPIIDYDFVQSIGLSLLL